MQPDFTQRMTTCRRGRVSRRVFLGALGASALAPRSFAQASPPIPITAINHMTLSVSDPARSLEWYQGLFGMPIAARQANTVILRVGDGPQFMAIGGGASGNPHINHLCLSTPGFDADRIVAYLGRPWRDVCADLGSYGGSHTDARRGFRWCAGRYA